MKYSNNLEREDILMKKILLVTLLMVTMVSGQKWERATYEGENILLNKSHTGLITLGYLKQDGTEYMYIHDNIRSCPSHSGSALAEVDDTKHFIIKYVANERLIVYHIPYALLQAMLSGSELHINGKWDVGIWIILGNFKEAWR